MVNPLHQRITEIGHGWKASLPSSRVPAPSETDVLKAAAKYKRTGTIPEILWQYYDQRGRWIGALHVWRRKTRATAKDLMKKSKLPKKHIVTQTPYGEMILNTSFVISSKRTVCIPYHEIKGSVLISKVDVLFAVALRTVAGNFICMNRYLIDLTDLAEVHGDFRVPYSRNLRIPALAHVGGRVVVLACALPHLETVGSHLVARFVEVLETPKLVYVGGDVSARTAQRMIMPNLEFIGRELEISLVCARVDAPRLEVIGRDFIAPTTKTIRMRNLKMVGGDMNTRASEEFYLPGLVVGGNWEMYPHAPKVWAAAEHARGLLERETGWWL